MCTTRDCLEIPFPVFTLSFFTPCLCSLKYLVLYVYFVYFYKSLGKKVKSEFCTLVRPEEGMKEEGLYRFWKSRSRRFSWYSWRTNLMTLRIDSRDEGTTREDARKCPVGLTGKILALECNQRKTS